MFWNLSYTLVYYDIFVWIISLWVPSNGTSLCMKLLNVVFDLFIDVLSSSPSFASDRSFIHLVTSVLLRFNTFLDPHFMLSFLCLTIYLSLSLSFYNSTYLISSHLLTCQFTSDSTPPPPPTPSRIFSTVHQSGCR